MDNVDYETNVFGGSYVSGGGEMNHALYAVLVILTLVVVYYVWTKMKSKKHGAHGPHGIHGSKVIGAGGRAY